MNQTCEASEEDYCARHDEIEALAAIYPGDIEVKEDKMVPISGGEWELHRHPGAIITIQPFDEFQTSHSASFSVRLDVSTPQDYPSTSPPNYRLVTGHVNWFVVNITDGIKNLIQ